MQKFTVTELTESTIHVGQEARVRGTLFVADKDKAWLEEGGTILPIANSRELVKSMLSHIAAYGGGYLYEEICDLTVELETSNLGISLRVLKCVVTRDSCEFHLFIGR